MSIMHRCKKKKKKIISILLMIVDLRMLALISPNFGYKMGVLFNRSSPCNYGLADKVLDWIMQ